MPATAHEGGNGHRGDLAPSGGDGSFIVRSGQQRCQPGGVKANVLPTVTRDVEQDLLTASGIGIMRVDFAECVERSAEKQYLDESTRDTTSAHASPPPHGGDEEAAANSMPSNNTFQEEGPRAGDENEQRRDVNPISQAEAIENLRNTLKTHKRQERMAWLYIVGQGIFILYSVYDVFGVLMDIITDAIFFAEFRRAYPEERGLQAVLIVSMILPLVALAFVVYRRLMGFRPPVPKRDDAEEDGTNEDGDGSSIFSDSGILGGIKSFHRDLWGAGPLYWLLYILSGVAVVAVAALVLGVAAVIISIVLVFLGSLFALLWLIADLSSLCDLDMWHFMSGMPGEEFMPVRGMLYGMLEDLPQLGVQVWVLATDRGGEGGDRPSVATLAFAVFTTVLNILNQGYKLWKRASMMRGHGMLVWRYFGNTFGLVRADKTFASAYASLIREGSYNHEFLSIRCAGIGDDECIDLIDAIEFDHKKEKEENDDIFTIAKEISSLTLAYNCIGDRGIERLAGAMERNVPFQRIDVQGNQLSSAGAKRLALAIRNGAPLSLLNLRENPKIDKDAYDDLVAASSERGNCIELTFSDCEETDHLRDAVNVDLEKRFWDDLRDV